MFIIHDPVRRLAHGLFSASTFVLLTFIILITPLEAEVKVPHVLILNSYGEIFPWTENLTDSIISTFNEGKFRAELIVEFMDSKRFAYPGYMGRLAEIYAKKYRNVEFELIIATDDNAVRFLSLFGDSLFTGVPVVFLGVNDRTFIREANFPNMTGLIENIDIRGTVELAISLHPGTRKLVLISDFTRTGINHIQRFRELSQTLPKDLEIIELIGLERSDLEERLKALDKDSVVLFFSYYRDSTGNGYFPKQVQEILKAAGSVPVYSFWDYMVSQPGGSVLGGMTISSTSYGREAARTAISVLSGKTLSEIPIEWDGPDTHPSFNYQLLKENGIEEKDLPETSQIYNIPQSVFSGYGKVIIANMGFLLFLVILVFYLAMNVYSRKKTEKALSREKKYWESLFEYSPEAIVCSDSKGILKRSNRKFHELFGYQEKEIIGKSLDGLFARSREQFREATALSRTMSEGKRVGVETTRMAKDGRNIPVLMMGLPLTIGGKHMADFCIYRDITDQKGSEEELKHRLRFEEIISRISSKLVFVKNVDRVVLEVMEELRMFLGCSYIGLARIDRPSGSVNITHEAYEEDVLPFKIKNTPLNNLSGVMRDLRTMGEFILEDISSHSIVDPFISTITEKRDSRSLLILPLNMKKDLEGMLIFENLWIGKHWNDYDISLLQTFSDILGEAFRRVSSSEKLQTTMTDLKRAFEGTFSTMTKILEIKDPYTAGHQQKVTQLAKAIALEMNLPGDRVDAVYYASLVHDIGKINIPSEILSKPVKLTEIEFSLIKNHTTYGWEILHNIFFPWPISDIVLQHHERLDGSGYPKGLKGRQILLEARIITVADVVEAMASDRPYRPSLGIEKALEEIEKNSGRWYMPEAVRACITLFREKGFIFREPSQ